MNRTPLIGRSFDLWVVRRDAPDRACGRYRERMVVALCQGCDREYTVRANVLRRGSRGCVSCTHGRDDDRRHLAAELDGQGLTCREIGERLGCNRSTAHKLVKAYRAWGAA